MPHFQRPIILRSRVFLFRSYGANHSWDSCPQNLRTAASLPTPGQYRCQCCLRDKVPHPTVHTCLGSYACQNCYLPLHRPTIYLLLSVFYLLGQCHLSSDKYLQSSHPASEAWVSS